ncbi:MAG: low molecular weight protein-tyrosine-phosphatase [Methyloligellaceae bacterium]
MIEHRILFICLGNICRSPLAEGVFRHLVAGRGAAERFRIDSAGTGAWHVGEPPDARAQEAALGRGIDISAQKARQVVADDFERFDMLLAMDESNRFELQRLGPEADRDKARLLLSFAPDSGRLDIPDPYYGGPPGFTHVLDLIETASEGLFQALVERDHPHQP